MIAFLKIQWKLGKIDEAYLDTKVSQGKITLEQKQEIMSAE